jgi:hypothetical protein
MKMEQSETAGVTTYTSTTKSGAGSIVVDGILYVKTDGHDIIKTKIICSDEKLIQLRLQTNHEINESTKTTEEFYIGELFSLTKKTTILRNDDPKDPYSGKLVEVCNRLANPIQN